MRWRPLFRWLLAVAPLAGAGCGAAPVAPTRPTWADVQPIVQGDCSGCHGSTADATGAGFRFDFYDMTATTCGDAARAMRSSTILAASAAPAIATDVTLGSNGRSKMPPYPGAPLAGWERDTLLRWAAQPVKGPPPDGNRPPVIDVGQLPFMIDKQLTFTAVLSDPDGQEAVGALEINGMAFLMNRSGSFAVNMDASQWPSGTQHLQAILCDGWTSVTYDLGPIQIQH